MQPEMRVPVLDSVTTLYQNRVGYTEVPPEFADDPNNLLDVYASLDRSLESLLPEGYFTRRLNQYTPKLQIQEYHESGVGIETVQLQFGLINWRGSHSLRADWYVGERLAYQEEISQSVLGPGAANDVYNFAWSFIQYRNALLSMSEGELAEMGFRLESIESLRQAAEAVGMAK